MTTLLITLALHSALPSDSDINALYEHDMRSEIHLSEQSISTLQLLSNIN